MRPSGKLGMLTTSPDSSSVIGGNPRNVMPKLVSLPVILSHKLSPYPSFSKTYPRSGTTQYGSCSAIWPYISRIVGYQYSSSSSSSSSLIPFPLGRFALEFHPKWLPKLPLQNMYGLRSLADSYHPSSKRAEREFVVSITVLIITYFFAS